MLSWFHSYFTNRTQIITCQGRLSKPNPLTIGIPQGTVLGPIYFLIYVNDLPSHIKSVDGSMYADDISLMVHGNTTQELEDNSKQCLSEAAEWFTANRLIVNPSKSSTMLITTSHMSKNVITPPVVTIYNVPLPNCQFAKLLGVVIDSDVKWDKHIEYLCKKVNPKIGIIHRLRPILPTSCLNTIYLTLVQPHLDYCITVWGSCANKYILVLQHIQNRAARAVTRNFDQKSSVSAIIKSLNWLPIKLRYKHFLEILVFKCHQTLAPISLTNCLRPMDCGRHYYTRSVANKNLLVPRLNLEMYNVSLVTMVPRFGNLSPFILRSPLPLYF